MRRIHMSIGTKPVELPAECHAPVGSPVLDGVVGRLKDIAAFLDGHGIRRAIPHINEAIEAIRAEMAAAGTAAAGG
jgi:hypothetical protein